MRKVFDWYLKFFLLGCMVFFVPGKQFYGAQECFFQYGTMGMLGLCYFVPRKRQILNPYLGAILLYALVNTVIFHFGDLNRMILLNIFLGFVLIKELAERIDLDFKAIGEFMALFCAFNVLWMILQIYDIDPVFSSVAPGLFEGPCMVFFTYSSKYLFRTYSFASATVTIWLLEVLCLEFVPYHIS